MIKAAGRNDDGIPITILGLTPQNLRELKQGNPIMVNQGDLELPPGMIVVMYGETNDAITAQLRSGGLPINDMGQPKPGQAFRQRP